MLDLPTTKEEIERLVSSRVPEDIHLDYKQSGAIDHSKRDEIAKDVSAFANSDGGLIIYGVIEQGSLPLRIDDGVNHQKFSREWLEQVIGSNITPRVDDVKIVQIPLSSDRSLYTVLIPKVFVVLIKLPPSTTSSATILLLRPWRTTKLAMFANDGVLYSLW